MFTTRKSRENLVKVFAVVMLIASLACIVLFAMSIWTGMRLLSISNEIGYMNHQNTVSLFFWNADNIARYDELVAKRMEIYHSSNPWVAFISTAPKLAQVLIPTALLVLAIFLGNMALAANAALVQKEKKTRK